MQAPREEILRRFGLNSFLRLVISNFPDLKSDQAEAAARASNATEELPQQELRLALRR